MLGSDLRAPSYGVGINCKVALTEPMQQRNLQYGSWILLTSNPHFVNQNISTEAPGEGVRMWKYRPLGRNLDRDRADYHEQLREDRDTTRG
jgi:hypothetical protein